MIPSVIGLAARGVFAAEDVSHGTHAASEVGVTLRQEVAMIDAYAAAQKVHGIEPRNVRLDVAPGAMDAQVPTLFLQLLVENVLWQMRRTNGEGTVQLTAQREGDELHLGMRIVMPFRG